jgi:hypothetical protein
VPLSQFEGRVPATTTEYEYDGGLMVRSTTTSEPLWTEHDQAVMVALARYRETLCSCCGLPAAMTLADERDAPQFVVSKRYCLARRVLIETQQAFTNQGKDVKPSHGALQWSVRVRK